MKDNLDVDEPQLARRRKVPKEFEQGSAPAKFAKGEYWWLYFKVIDFCCDEHPHTI